MLAPIEPALSQTPADKAWHDEAVRSREAAPPNPRRVSSAETERRRLQMEALGDVVAERHRELRQGRR